LKDLGDRLFPYRGGNWTNGANAGVFALNLNNARSNVNTNIGFRAAFSHSQILQTYGVCFQYGEEKGVCFRAGIRCPPQQQREKMSAKNKTAAKPIVGDSRTPSSAAI